MDPRHSYLRPILLCPHLGTRHPPVSFWQEIIVLGPFINKIMDKAWISNINDKVLDEITRPFPNGCIIEVCEWISNFIPQVTRLVFIHVTKRDPYIIEFVSGGEMIQIMVTDCQLQCWNDSKWLL